MRLQGFPGTNHLAKPLMKAHVLWVKGQGRIGHLGILANASWAGPFVCLVEIDTDTQIFFYNEIKDEKGRLWAC